MKQTQTKLFDFSDAGLDFSAGSKNLFPDRFKKMLALGYNEQTVLSVTVLGNQVTFTYGGVHGYVTDRVLKIDSGSLSLINEGEFWIDSVTTNTVTFTLDDAPISITGGFTTRIAPLGWSLEYESGNIQLYKLKNMDETDLFLRLCFQNLSSGRNCISPCLGKTANLTTGEITDIYAFNANKSIESPTSVAAGNRWEFSGYNSSTYDNYTYSQGASMFGVGIVVGSLYHFISVTNNFNSNGRGFVNGFLPCFTHNYDAIKLPLLIMHYNTNTGGLNLTTILSNVQPFIGNTRCVFHPNTGVSGVFSTPQAANSFTDLDGFNTTTCEPISIYEETTRQHIGYISGGMYVAKYASANAPTLTIAASPSFSMDIDLNSKIVLHYISNSANASSAVFFAIPVEPIKYA
ncbi:hypothetical protein [Acinetobacter sp. ANC 5414]|uniref:hypothetical protein n=1 Tax=Acinetobacter sp. ANC 5414 TaxID=2731251 RepID=UPI00148F615D|nr:hypothetical protein [Acinetobacter sp. ANC 5414]NNH01677.1 hypothetical protein [Acinetobacter sp. ANC 5414]